MSRTRIIEIIGKSTSLRDALLRTGKAFGLGRIEFLFYGFTVHLHGIKRNDALICHSAAGDEIAIAFQAAGGTMTDVVAAKMPDLAAPFALDIVGLAEHMRATGDPRLAFVDTILDYGVRTAWICPITQGWVGGYGVLNQFYRDRFAEPSIPVEDLAAFAHQFHEEAKRHRLIAKELALRSSQMAILAQVAMGRSAEDLAALYGVSNRAIEKRLQNIRGKLKARNTLEAVYKSTIYGVLPYTPMKRA